MCSIDRPFPPHAAFIDDVVKLASIGDSELFHATNVPDGRAKPLNQGTSKTLARSKRGVHICVSVDRVLLALRTPVQLVAQTVSAPLQI